MYLLWFSQMHLQKDLLNNVQWSFLYLWPKFMIQGLVLLRLCSNEGCFNISRRIICHSCNQKLQVKGLHTQTCKVNVPFLGYVQEFVKRNKLSKILRKWKISNMVVNNEKHVWRNNLKTFLVISKLNKILINILVLLITFCFWQHFIGTKIFYIWWVDMWQIFGCIILLKIM